MRRKGLALLMALALVLSFSTVALATPGVDEVGVQGVFIDPIADMTLTQVELDAGYDVSVAGYVGFLTGLNPAGNPTNPKLTSLKLEVAKDGGAYSQVDYTSGYSYPSTTLSSRANIPGQEFNFTQPWTITEVGNYTLRVTATFTSAGTYPAQFDTEAVTVTLLECINVDYPAAPAVAAAILKDAGIEHRYDTGEVNGKGRAIFGNYVSDVARMMGSQPEDQNGSWFMGIDKVDHDEYYEAVYEYLQYLGADLP